MVWCVSKPDGLFLSPGPLWADVDVVETAAVAFESTNAGVTGQPARQAPGFSVDAEINSSATKVVGTALAANPAVVSFGAMG